MDQAIHEALQQSIPLEGKIDSLIEYDSFFNLMITKTSRTIKIFDYALNSSYNDLQRISSTIRFLSSHPSNRIHIVVHDASLLQRNCPRWMNFMRTYSQSCLLEQTHPTNKHFETAFVIFDHRHFCHRFHSLRSNGKFCVNHLEQSRYLIKIFEQARCNALTMRPRYVTEI